jgi:acyl-[acyl-carrier-protein]-phospholipid O-acyltransferase/long-chain-fatty-acid--[acyl-carrier-protein] ligase
MLGRLMTTRRFVPLFWCQFFSAFNDNFVKNALVVLILFQLALENGPLLVTLAGGLFMLPFFLLSSVGGEMADRFDKAVVARRLKFAEIFVVLVAGVGFVLHEPYVLLAALTGMGVMGALFGPIKYGILPDHLSREELVAGNALVETATFLAILGGTVGGTLAIKHMEPHLVAGVTVGFGVVSWIAAAFIPRTGSRAPDLKIDFNIARGTYRLLRQLYAQRPIFKAALVVSWFWAVGIIALSLVPTIVKENVGGDENVTTLFIACFVVGIAFGSLLAARLSRGRIILALAPIGSFLMGLFGLDLGLLMMGDAPAVGSVTWATFFSDPHGVRAAFDLIGFATAGGLLIVPVFAWMQAASGEDERARVIAGNNVLNAAFMVAATVIIVGLQAAGLGAALLFALTAAASLVAAFVIARLLPGSFLRDLVLLIFRFAFRLEVHGEEHLRNAGPNAVIAVNHVSFLDAPLVMSLLDTDPVFAIDKTIATRWWVKPFLKLARTYALDPTKPMATRALINQVKAGDSLVIFPEGRITVTGSLMKIYDGAALVADKAGAPVIPVRIDGLEQTPFSHLNAKQTHKRWFPKVTVTILPSRRLDVDQTLVGRRRRHAAGAALTDEMSDAIFRTTPIDRTLPEAVAAAAAKYGSGRIAVQDPLGAELSYSKLLLGTSVLAQKLAAETVAGETVGVLLPNSAGVAVVLLALQRIGRVPAMLNFTAGPANLVAACKAAEIRTVYCARSFVEKARLEKEIAALSQAVRVVMLEDLRASIGTMDKLRGFLGARSIPRGDPEAPAVVLFTSGSEGTPKGVVLSHRNILANCAQVAARIDFGPADIIFNVLPVFHSFGLTGGLMLPLVSGVKTYLYPSPLHYRIIPELVYATNATALFGTDTFLTGYARSANAYDFRSLRFVVAGAEPVKPETRKVWSERFGLRILEGYGITEASPVVAVNTPMFNKAGTVGRLLPALEHRLEAVDGVDTGGRLMLRGPNIMLGYLRSEAPGVLEPPPEGWHDTGDIVAVDTEGFVAIKGRLKRFAKVAGEMVSLSAVESFVQAAFPAHQHAAVALPDPRKGERIVLVTTEPGLTRAAVVEAGRAAHAAELMFPAEVLIVEHLPLLGSGKTDYVGITRLVAERTAAVAAAAAPAEAAAAARAAE